MGLFPSKDDIMINHNRNLSITYLTGVIKINDLILFFMVLYQVYSRNYK
jgi:hypothetical protein